MLKDKLYRINTITILPVEGGDNPVQKFSVQLNLDGTHGIFQGHFPGNPVLPGVCQVEMVRELAEEITGRKLMLSQASQVKYLNLINPLLCPLLVMNMRLTIQDPINMEVYAELASADTIFMKMKGRFNEIKA
ncbi:MAG: 3-hydroxyacyl-ACP dehydratase [Bacteroidota bacterium]|jgi:3-hydroxyacyl-[acyl-carrier-protein] dehydratase